MSEEGNTAQGNMIEEAVNNQVLQTDFKELTEGTKMIGDQVAFDDNTTTPNDKKVGDVLDRESALHYEDEIFD